MTKSIGVLRRGEGGLGYLLVTTRINHVLFLVLDCCAAIYLPLAVFGLSAPGSWLASTHWWLIGMNSYLLAVAGKQALTVAERGESTRGAS